MVDANIVMGAMIRDGTTRHLLFSAPLDLHAPESLWEELERNRPYLLRKSGATDAAFQLLLDQLRSRIKGVPIEVLRDHIDDALSRLGPKDRLDAPYVAAAMAIRGTLWSHDRRLSRSAGIPNVTTREVIAHLEV